MRIEWKMEADCPEPKVVVVSNRLSDEVKQLLETLAAGSADTLAGTLGGETVLVRPDEVARVYTEGQKVVAETDVGKLALRQRLYELEQRLEPQGFVRVSQSEIVNIKRIRRLDLRLSGSVRLQLTTGEQTWISRRYVSKVKQRLGL